ncbi:MAG: molybdenum cofactor guanylyltransferase [Flavobacteriaceae bacterium]|mgnify:CR=1 FL=1|jgi:molybdopterin-guanine dinucleotide biosynthesis protein A|nr:molybdenum cofactor guanylyltransferase [Flavobacteriaceae bacterium]
MKNKKHITGIILAGGKSSRMGTDKGFVLYKNKSFVQHIIEALQPLVDEIIIVSNNPDYDVFALRHRSENDFILIKRVGDLIENAGPLAGVYTGLDYSETENNLVISCDVPLINSETLTLLIDGIEDHTEVVQLESNGKSMPLIAMYKKQSKEVFYSLLKDGERRLRVALTHVKVKTIVLTKNQDRFTSNINTLKNLNEIEP